MQEVPDRYVNDDFRHELAFYTEGLLFTGCAHSGLENILAACPFPVNTVVGGLHLLDNHESEDNLSELAYRLTGSYPWTKTPFMDKSKKSPRFLSTKGLFFVFSYAIRRVKHRK